MSLLEIDSVDFSYGEHQVLSNIYLKVVNGEVVGFLGRNGCGKSTLLKLIFGSLKGQGQSVRIDGAYVSRAFQTGLIKFAPQEPFFPGYLNPVHAAGLFDVSLDLFEDQEEFADNKRMKFAEMSAGIRKYIETLIVLFSPGSFILLDEPFSFISPVLVEKLIPIIREVSKEKGVILTDHQYHSILDVSDRLYLMSNQALIPITGEQDLRDMGYLL